MVQVQGLLAILMAPTMSALRISLLSARQRTTVQTSAVASYAPWVSESSASTTPTSPPAIAMTASDEDVVQRRAALAMEWIQNEGFYSPVKKELMAENFVFMGPIVGPLNTDDYLGTLGVFKIYDAFPDKVVSAAPFTQDPGNPDRFWSIIRVKGTHTGPLNVGSAIVPPTGNAMVVGPQAVSVTFDESDKVKAFTGGYITDVRDGETGDAGAMFAVMKACGVPT